MSAEQMQEKTQKYIVSISDDGFGGANVAGSRYAPGAHIIELTEAQAARAAQKPRIKVKLVAESAGLAKAGEVVSLNSDEAAVIRGYYSLLKELQEKGAPTPSGADYVALARQAFFAALAKAETPAPAKAAPATVESKPVAAPVEAPPAEAAEAPSKSSHLDVEAESTAARAGKKK